MDDKEVKNALEDHSYHDAWTRIYRAPDHEAYFNYVFDRIDRVYRDTAPGAVLDAGCGTGNHIRHLTAIGYDVHGVDYSPVAVERCRKELARIESQLDKAATRIASLHEQMADAASDYGKLARLQGELDAVQASHDELELAWLAAAEELEG